MQDRRRRALAAGSALWRRSRRLVIVLASTVLFALAGWAIALWQPGPYVATTTLALLNASPATFTGAADQGIADERYVLTEARRMESEAVLRQAASGASGTPSVDRLDRAIRVVGIDGDTVLEIRASHQDPVRAADWADAVATAYRQVVRNQSRGVVEALGMVLADGKSDAVRRLEELEGADPEDPTVVGQREALVREIAALDAQLLHAELSLALVGSGIAWRDGGEIPTSRSVVRPIAWIAIGAAVGLLVGVMSLARERRERQRVHESATP